MTISYSRAQRRHDYFRLKENRKNNWGYGSYSDDVMSDENRGRAADTPCSCSCSMCGNPRRTAWNGKERKTMQERKQVPVDLLVDEWYNKTHIIEDFYMNERDIAKYAALVATGVITEDLLLEQLGDDSIVSQIMAVAGASAVVGAASGVVEDVVDTVFDVVDDFNPFSGW